MKLLKIFFFATIVSFVAVFGLDDGVYTAKIKGGVTGSRKYLSVPSNPTFVDLWTTDDLSGRQRWRITAVPSTSLYTIRILEGVSGNNKYLTAPSSGSTLSFASSDTGNGLQRWTFTNNTSYFHIRALTGRSSTYYNYLSTTSTGTLVDLYISDDGSDRQRWILKKLQFTGIGIAYQPPNQYVSLTSSGPGQSVMAERGEYQSCWWIFDSPFVAGAFHMREYRDNDPYNNRWLSQQNSAPSVVYVPDDELEDETWSIIPCTLEGETDYFFLQSPLGQSYPTLCANTDTQAELVLQDWSWYVLNEQEGVPDRCKFGYTSTCAEPPP